MAKKGTMTEGSRKVFDYLKAETIKDGIGRKFTTKEVQTALNFENAGSVTGSVTGLCKKKPALAERFTETVEVEDGKTKEIKYFALTEAGVNFDPDAIIENED